MINVSMTGSLSVMNAPEATLDPTQAYKLHPKVALRPEPFGALAYHYGNRKLVFLKSPRMVTLVRDLGTFATLDSALTSAGLTERSRPKYLAALNSLAQSDMLIPATEQAPHLADERGPNSAQFVPIGEAR